MSDGGPTDPKTLVIVPTYNERESLPVAVAAIAEHCPGVDVLVVDDNSPDGTGQLADDLARHDSRVSVLHRPGKQGLGVAYIAGFQEALNRGYELPLHKSFSKLFDRIHNIA